MARVEDAHWWYRGLRSIIDLALTRETGPASPSLLDVGCGTGGNLAALRARARVVGVDFAPEAVAACRARGFSATAVASAGALPFRDASFDVVLSCDVLCHRSIDDEVDVLREMARVLRPGGTLLLNLPAYAWLHSPHDRATQQNKRYTRPAVRRLLQSGGFEPRWLTHWNGVLLPAAIALRAWRRWSAAAGSDLDAASGPLLGSVFSAALAIERAWLQHGPLAFGLSVFAVARRP